MIFVDCAEQVASVATSTINLSAKRTDKHSIEAVPPKIYNVNSGKSIPTMPSLEKHRDTRSIDVDCRYSLTEKNIADSKDSINNFYTYDASDKSEQKYVHTHTSDQMSLTIYNDISGNLIQKQQNGSNDSKDSNRYDKKLNQSSFKPSISNVFNSLNEYINAPTGSSNHVQPMLDDLPKMSSSIMEKDLTLSKDVATNKYAVPKKKDIIDITDKNTLDCKNILPVEASTFVEVEIGNKQDNAMQNVISQNSTLIQSDKNNSNVIIFVPNTTVSKNEHDNISTSSTEMFKTDINKKALVNDGVFEEIYKNISSEQKHLDLRDQNFIDECVFIENKERNCVLEDTIKLDTSIKNNENHNENMETTKNCNILSNILHTIDTSDDFSEEKLNQYLLELEKEEKSMTEDISHTSDIWSLKTQDEIKDKESTVSHCQQDDINEAPIFEKIIIDELSKISEDDIQEKVKKFSVIDYIDVHNENITDIECNDAIKIALQEKNNSDRQNKLDKIIKDKDVIEAINQDHQVPEDTLQFVSNAVEVKVASKFENVKEQNNQQDNINIIQKLQDISKDMQLQNNNSDILENLSDNNDYNESIYHQDISEESNNIVTLNDNKTYDNDLVFKMEIDKTTDACTISYTNEDNQESEKPSRPQTLDIISTHNKNDCHILGMLLKNFSFIFSYTHCVIYYIIYIIIVLYFYCAIYWIDA